MAEARPPSQLNRWRQRVRRFVVHDILHADDPPHRLALGIGLGVFVGLQPIFGFQMVAVVFMSWLLGANKLVGAPVVWISNPATAIPIYYGCYAVGVAVLGGDPVGAEWWREMAHPPAGWWSAVSFYWSRLADIGIPLWLGCTVLGVAFGYPAYLVTYYMIRSYRLRRWGQLTPPGAQAAKQVAGQAKPDEEVPSAPPYSDQPAPSSVED